MQIVFRGEPIALWTLIFGFLSFILVQVLGLGITGVIDLDFPLIIQSHFYLAFFGWIGLTLLGSQLQFYRAITGLRKYTPQYFRYLYLLFLVLGLILMVYGSYGTEVNLVSLGIFIYFLGVLIHTYWIAKQSSSKYFKFPLDYMFVSNLFLIISLIFLYLSSTANEYIQINRNSIRHILSIGWISITLQGALVRILPMFVGKSLVRESRKSLKPHFIYSSVSSLLLIISFTFENDLIISIAGFVWFLSWVWTLLILKKSIVRGGLLYKQTLFFFIPGIIWFTIGAILGFYISFQDNLNINTNFRALHIHISLLLGLTLIMLGAFHRITSFQIYTLLYTGKKEVSIDLKQMLRLKRLLFSAVLYNISVVYMVYGFVDNNFERVGQGGILILISTGIYGTIILQNLIHYMMNKNSAIPFWLKSSEYDTSEPNDS